MTLVAIRCTRCRTVLGEMRDGVLCIGAVRVTRAQALTCDACGKVRLWQPAKQKESNDGCGSSARV